MNNCIRFLLPLVVMIFSSVIQADDKGATLGHIRWDTNIINVCWISPSPAHAVYRDMVRNAVQATWVKQSNVQLTGWSECQPNEKAVRIFVGPREWPRASVGKTAYLSNPSMWLNFELDKKREFSGCSGKQLDQCIRVISVHEFGHMLGLIHEQDRPDAPDECQKSLATDQINLNNRNAADLLMLTSYDSKSAMNYCNAKGMYAAKLDSILSPDDIAAIRVLFGDPENGNRSSRQVGGGLQHLHDMLR